MALPLKKTHQGIRINNVEFIWARNSKDFFFSTSILIHDNESLLVDPSANFSYLETLSSQKKIHHVVNTHYHVDHRSLNSLFRPKAKFYCHPLDKPLMKLENYLKYADSESDSNYVKWLQGIFSSLDLTNPYFHDTLEEGHRLPVKDQEVQVLHLPGHTPGHIGLFFKDIHLLFTSDVDLTPLGPWYANIHSNIDDFRATIERLKGFECDYYVTSHGSRIYKREQFLKKLERFEAAFDQRDEKILTSLKKKPKDLLTICREGIIYRKVQLAKDPLMQAFERQMLEKHLKRLALKNLVHQEANQQWALSS